MEIIREQVTSSVDATCLTNDFKIPVAHPKRRTPADNHLNTDLGLVYELDTERGVEDGEDDQDAQNPSANGMQVSSDSRFLAIRVQLYDRDRSYERGFRPTVFGAMLTDTYRTKASKGKPDEEKRDFGIRRAVFLKLLRKLDASIVAEQPLTMKIPKGTMTTTVARLYSKPLAEFQSEQAVADFIQKLLPADES
ncbi:hypothetical protein NHH03_16265 [Stieleria sp. TO1_6]|uniref:hypothetical protein n=1 Tax=Stieleria tagensis TaxID=2956795 RepID=UPI00209A7E1B|nr:hypothetical protein [Stieleria tagensis]MCO8123305.1 hypothetical protein [Stieleria tagensis]